MIGIRKDTFKESVRQSASHVLYVEGVDGDSLDSEVFKEFLYMIDVKGMGPSYSIKSVAKALHQHHPNDYFLIDRDHHDDDTVESCWRDFPDPKQDNLLIWRKREIENYFLDPDYLKKSKFFINKDGEPETTILRLANERVYLDTVNHVIVSVREEQKRNWIELFSTPQDFKSRKDVEKRLTAFSAKFETRKADVAASVTMENLMQRFDETLSVFSGGSLPLEFGRGKWLDGLRGKKILPSVLNTCFQVKDREGISLQGREKMREVVRSLLKLPFIEQPDDFQKLFKLIEMRVAMP